MPTMHRKLAFLLALFGLLAVRSASAQNLQPFGPYVTEGDLQFFEPFQDGEFGKYPEEEFGAYAQYERAFWSFSKPFVTKIGSLQAEGDFRVEGQVIREENSLDTSIFNASAGWGNRFDLGYVQENRHGWQVGIIHNVSQNQNFFATDVLVLFNDPENLIPQVFVDRDMDGFDDDLNDNRTFGADGTDLGTEEDEGVFVLPFDGEPDELLFVDVGDATTILPRFSDFTARNSITMNSVELMRSYRFRQGPLGGIFEFYYGARYLQIRDVFAMNFIFGNAAMMNENRGIFDDTAVTTEVKNNIVGPQIGGRWTHQRQRWTFVAEGRFLAGFNAQNVNQASVISTGTPEPDPDVDSQIFSKGHVVSDYIEEYSSVAELRLSTTLAVTNSIDLTVGYTMHYLDNIARASNRIDYTVPNFGLTRPDHEKLWTHGVNFGVVLNRR